MNPTVYARIVAAEDGFGPQQDNVLRALGCTDPSDAYLTGGIDTFHAEEMISQACGVDIPRIESNAYIGLLDECGGHKSDVRNSLHEHGLGVANNT